MVISEDERRVMLRDALQEAFDSLYGQVSPEDKTKFLNLTSLILMEYGTVAKLAFNIQCPSTWDDCGNGRCAPSGEC
jgi:hypothetical protein